MNNPLYQKLVEQFGEEFARKYFAKRRAAMNITLKPEDLEKIKAFADEHIMKSEDFRVNYTVDNWTYDVILVETPTKKSLREVKPTSGRNWKALVVWAGSPLDTDFVSVFAPEGEAKKLEKPGLFYLVGKLKEREYNGRKNLIFNATAVIPLAKLDEPAPSSPSGGDMEELSNEEIDEFLEVEEITIEPRG